MAPLDILIIIYKCAFLTGALGKRKLFQDRPSSSIDSIDSEALLQAGPLVPLIIEVTFKELREVRGTIGNTKSGRQVLEELQKRYDFEVTTKLLSQVSKIVSTLRLHFRIVWVVFREGLRLPPPNIYQL